MYLPGYLSALAFILPAFFFLAFRCEVFFFFPLFPRFQEKLAKLKTGNPAELRICNTERPVGDIIEIPP